MRAFFERFARENAFDPLDHTSWYPCLKDLRTRQVPVVRLYHLLSCPSTQGARAIQKCYGGMKNALKAVFPEVSFTKWGTATS